MVPDVSFEAMLNSAGSCFKRGNELPTLDRWARELTIDGDHVPPDTIGSQLCAFNGPIVVPRCWHLILVKDSVDILVQVSMVWRSKTIMVHVQQQRQHQPGHQKREPR